MSLVPGKNFGNYQVVKLLGRGGMGEVYLATDRRLKRQVAIKVLSSDLLESRDQLRRFRKEASYAAVLNHPNICTIYEAGEIKTQTYICMEYVEGITLRQHISSKPMGLPEVLDIAIQIADALDEARKKNVIHRDIKSSNILLTSRKHVKILDFGLAKQMPSLEGKDLSDVSTASSFTDPGEPVRGTLAYMSPEAVLGKPVDHRSDIFSFGVVLYEMLAGRVPFDGNTTVQVFDAILHHDPTPVTRFNNKVPDSLVRVLAKMLEKDVENRYQSVHEVWIDLRRIKEENTRTATVAPSHIGRARITTPRTTALFTLLLVLAAVLSGIYFFHKRSVTPTPSIANQKLKTLAVLPFQYNGDPEHEYLGRMVTDALIGGLQSSPGLAVAPYESVHKLEKNASNKEIGRDLGVQFVLRGKIFQDQNQLNIQPELSSSEGVIVWKQNVTGTVDHPIHTMDSVKEALINDLNASETGSAKELTRIRTPSEEAYRYYSQAMEREEERDVGNNLQEAITLYQKALEIDQDFAVAHARLAMALITQYRNSKEPSLLVSAAEEADEALGINSNLPEVLIAQGLVQLERGNSVEAKDHFLRALNLAPGNDAACRNIAAAYESLKRPSEAKELYLRAIALRPNYWINHYQYGRFEFQSGGNLPDARTSLLKANELHSQGSMPLVTLGLVEMISGNLDKAENYLRKAQKLKPDAYSFFNLGTVYYYRGQYDLAERNWDAVLQQDPENPLFQANVADALRQKGELGSARTYYAKAVKGFRSALAINPEDDSTRAGMAMALAALGRCEEAREETQKVTTRRNQSPELAAYAAVTASRCDDYKWAGQIVLNSIAMNSLVVIRFDPDLEPVRKIPEVKRALELAVSATSSTSEHKTSGRL